MSCDRRGCRRVVAVLALAVAVPATVRAQVAGPAPEGLPRPAIDGPVEYARFLPEGCLGVPEVVDRLRLEGGEDTTLYTPAQDRVAPEARVEVARCVAAAGPTARSPGQWLALARAELVLGDDAVAQTWHDKYLASVARASLLERAWALQLVVAAYAEARPARIAAAEAVLRRLDALGPPAARARVLAHQSLMDGATRQWNDAVRLREANACVAAYRELSDALRALVGVQASSCIWSKAELVLRQQGGPAAVAVLDTALSLSLGGPYLRSLYALVGHPAAPIEATRWFRRQGPQAKPAPGTVTLLHGVDHAQGSEAQYRALRRLAARFAGRPVELIAQTKTQGFFADSALPIPPERETVLDSAYFYGSARLPGLLAVYATPFTITADGRRVPAPTPHEQYYLNANLVVIDQRGLVRYVGHGLGGPDEELLARFIEALLAEP